MNSIDIGFTVVGFLLMCWVVGDYFYSKGYFKGLKDGNIIGLQDITVYILDKDKK